MGGGRAKRILLEVCGGGGVGVNENNMIELFNFEIVKSCLISTQTHILGVGWSKLGPNGEVGLIFEICLSAIYTYTSHTSHTNSVWHLMPVMLSTVRFHVMYQCGIPIKITENNFLSSINFR